MNLLNDALTDLSQFLSDNNINYMIIGGLANAVWGDPRATIDIDVTVWIEENEIQGAIAVFTSEYKSLVKSPADFIAKTRVLPMQAKNDVRIDVIFGALPFELDAVKRAIKINIDNTPVSFCSPEDLILLKIFSKRTKDLEDIRGIVKTRLNKLDMEYLEPRITELSTLLDDPDIRHFWTKCIDDNK